MAVMRFMVVLSLPAIVAGATLQSDTTLMRRQKEAHFGSGGDIMVVEEAPSETEMLQNLAAHAHLSKEKHGDLCNYNFAPGVPKKSNCTNPKLQKLIEDESVCMSAARLACPDGSCLGSPFMLNSHYFDKYPMRCFMTEDKPPKWHFNPSGYWPSNIAGTPICMEIEYVNGTKDSNECGQEDYKNVADESECRTVATCLAKCIHEQFRVLNTTAQNKAPAGCHVGKDGCVRFNPGKDAPKQPKGTPLCQLKLARGAPAAASAAGPAAAPAAASTGAATPAAAPAAASTPTAK